MSRFAGEMAAARAHFVAGRHAAARDVLMRVLGRAAGDPDANTAMAQVMMHLGDGPRALYFAERALDVAPRADLKRRAELAKMLGMLGRRERAGAELEKLVRESPGEAALRGALAWHLMLERRFGAAAREYRAALEQDADNAEYAADLSTCLTSMGRAPEAVAVLRDAVGRHPADPRLRSHLAFFLNYCPGAAREEVFQAHVEYGRIVGAGRPAGVATDRPADPERRITVGVISPDFSGHSVSYFIRPLLAHLEPEGTRTICYSTSPDKPGQKPAPPPHCSEFRKVYALGDEELAALVRRDGVDILIELSGHTAGNRLPLLRLRPAPILVSYLGYPNTTGMAEVGARFVDSLTDPPGADRWATERLIRLDPCFLCYEPAADAPAVGPLPSASGAPVTFASFNVLSKLNDEVIAVWAEVLGAVPGSRLLLKAHALGEEDVRAEVAGRLLRAGVEAARLRLVGWTPGVAAGMAMYGEVDVGLDPFPYNGTTTTADALWMGVPVVTLADDAHAGRVGLSMLTNVGLGELCAATRADYVRIAAELASHRAADRARLASLRATLRERMSSSPLMDGAGMGRRFGAALRALWRDWCAGRAGL